MARVWSRRDLEDRVNVLRERYDGEAFAAAVAEFSEELDPEEQEDLREILLERSREHAVKNAALEQRLDQGGWVRRTFGKIEDAERRQREQPLRRRLNELEERLASLTRRRAEIEAQLASADLYSSASKDRLKELLRDQARIKVEIDEVEQAWLKTSESLDKP